MQINITERDKKLLVFLAIFILVVVPYWFVLRPALAKGTELKRDIEVALAQKTQMENVISKYQENIALLEENKKLYEQEMTELNPVMENNRIDSMITDMVTNCNLEVIRLSISRDDNPQKVDPYENSLLSKEGADPANGENDPALYITGVNIMAKGTENDVYRLMDAVSSKIPGIRVVSYAINDSAGTGTVTLNASLNIHMADYKAEPKDN